MKKKSNSFELLIVVVLLLALGAYAFITYLINPLKTENASLETDIATEEGKLLIKYAKTTAYSSQTNRLETVKEALETWNGVFYANLNEEYLIDHIRKNLADNKLALISLNVKNGGVDLSSLLKASGNENAIYAANFPKEEEAVLTLDAFKKSYNAMKDEKTSILNSAVKTTSMTMTASGSYRNMLQFLTSVMVSGKSIMISNLSVEIPANTTIPKNEDALRANPNCTFNVTLVIVDIPAANTFAEKYTAEELVPYYFPIDILNKSYRTSLSGLAGLLGNLFK